MGIFGARFVMRARRACAVAVALVAVALVAVTASCVPPERPEGTAVIASGADLESGNPLVTVHPLSRQLHRYALFVTLFQLDSLQQIQPYLARSWQWNEQRTELRLKLHSTIKWHDGAATSAHDVAFSLTSVRDPRLGAPRAGDLANVSSIVAEDDSTVVVRFSNPAKSMPTVFAELPIAPKHILDTVPLERWRTNNFSVSPVGNGPFKFADRIAGRRWRFVRNDSFPQELGGPPLLQQLVVTVVDEAATKFAGLVSGELDMAGVSPSMAHLVKRDESLELLSPPVLFTTMVAFNTTQEPLASVAVRKAISMSLNRELIIQAAVAGYGEAAGGALPSGVPMAGQKAPVENVNIADSLLDAAGWLRGAGGVRERNGKPLKLTLLTVGSGDQAVEQIVQSDLSKRGINVEVRAVEMVTFLTMLRAESKQFDFAYTGLAGDVAAGHIRAMFSSSLKNGALDYTGWHDIEFDSAIAAVEAASTVNERRAAWSIVDSILTHNAPVAWVYHARGVQGKSRLLTGVYMDVRGELVSVTQWNRVTKGVTR